MKKKYIKAYKASALVFVLGAPAVIGVFIGLGMVAGVTAHLLAHLIKTSRNRMVYYICSLALSVIFIIICAVIFANENFSDRADSLEMTFSVLPLLVISGFMFLGVVSAFAARFVIWQQERAYYKRVETGKSGVNLVETDF
ncbi:MAG: hypothetical protein FWD48_08025 [Oscillospiraceae bacterium]|nr:hypothetical protein [Oscillospiraceae bacterium]